MTDTVIIGSAGKLVWDSPDSDKYVGVIVQEWQSDAWVTVVDYHKNYDPGFYDVDSGKKYRVISKWYTGSKFFSAKYPDGIYSGPIKEIIEPGIFSASSAEPQTNREIGLTLSDNSLINPTGGGITANPQVTNYTITSAFTKAYTDVATTGGFAGGQIENSNVYNVSYFSGMRKQYQDVVPDPSVAGGIIFRQSIDIDRLSGISIVVIG